MRRFSLALLTISFGVFVSSLLILGCSSKPKDDDDDDRSPPKKRGGTGPGPVAATMQKVDAKERTTLSGKVEFTGDPASVAGSLDAEMKAAIAGNTDNGFCLTGKKGGESTSVPEPYETNQQDYRIGTTNKGLGNVFVWIEAPQGSYFVIPDDQLAAVPKEVTINQPHCAFLPHCTVLFPSYYKDGVATKTGQKLVVENDALVLHNAKIAGEKNNPLNEGIPRRNADGTPNKVAYDFTPEKDAVTIGCNVHGWMKGYIRVHTHPYVAVTSVGADLKGPKKKVWENLASPEVGTYTIKGVPVGATVKVFAWHEKLGFLTKPSGDPIVLEKDMKKDFPAAPK